MVRRKAVLTQRFPPHIAHHEVIVVEAVNVGSASEAAIPRQ